MTSSQPAAPHGDARHSGDPLAVFAAQLEQAPGGRIELQEGLTMCRDRLVELGLAVADRIVPVTTAFLEADVATARDHAAVEPMISNGCTALEDACLLHKQLLSELYSGDQSTDQSISLALIARYYERLGDHGVDLARQVTFAVTGERAPDDD